MSCVYSEGLIVKEINKVGTVRSSKNVSSICAGVQPSKTCDEVVIASKSRPMLYSRTICKRNDISTIPCGNKVKRLRILRLITGKVSMSVWISNHRSSGNTYMGLKGCSELWIQNTPMNWLYDNEWAKRSYLWHIFSLSAYYFKEDTTQGWKVILAGLHFC